MFTLLQVVIRQESPTNGQINARITNPLAENVGIIVNFVWVVLAILALTTAYRIYSNWMNGEDENTVQSISKWLLGMVLCLALIGGLKLWLASNPAYDSGVNYNF